MGGVQCEISTWVTWNREGHECAAMQFDLARVLPYVPMPGSNVLVNVRGTHGHVDRSLEVVSVDFRLTDGITEICLGPVRATSETDFYALVAELKDHGWKEEMIHV
jgi:hypothetical protein